ncbi:MAG TPA: spore germination protein [Bacillota bacterium]|nr:spore germination protein [Bacillota bacterium]
MKTRKTLTAENEIVQAILELTGQPADLRLLSLGEDGSLNVMYLKSLVTLENYQGLINSLAQGLFVENGQISALGMNRSFQTHSDLNLAIEKLLEGRLLIIKAGQTNVFSLDLQGWLKRPPQEPQTERLIRGPREGFVETLDDNIGMVRRWVQDTKLKVEEMRLGRRTKTRVAIMYLSDVAQPRMVNEVNRRLSAIDIDGILESGYIEQLITDRRASIFPLTQCTERSDKVAAAILEGRVALLVDKSPTSVIVPVTINEMYQSPEDYYYNFWIGSFLRLIRLLGNNLAVIFPGLYIALVAFHPEMLPTPLALSIAATSARVPLPTVAELLLLEIMVEIFREAGLRLPGAVGQTLGVVAGIVLGMSAVEAGFVSPATLVVVAITAIASFTGPNYSVGIAWRLLKFFVVIAAAFFGLYGIIVGGMLILIHAADLKSFGVSYLAPWAPLQWNELNDGAVRKPFWARRYRPETYRPQDELRSGGTKREDNQFEE